MKPSPRCLSLTSIAALTLVGTVNSLQANVTVGVDPAASWMGYMNVSSLPSAGGGYQFGSGWGTADLTSSWSGSTLTLGPNTIGDPASYWYTPGGGPGALGNKIMDANLYVETTGVYTGQTLSFSGSVLSSSLLTSHDANGNGWTAVAFIKDFAPDYSSSVTVTAPLVNGVFNISLATLNDPSRHIQYGFETIGPDVWASDAGQYGTIQIAPVPEPSTLALLGLALTVPVVFRRRI